MNNLDLTVALATAPSSAFMELRERPKFWFPLVLLTVVTAAMAYWYYSVVDIEWLKDAMFSKMPDEQRAVAMGMMTRTTLLWSSLVGTLIMFPAVMAVSALYWLVAGKVTKLTPGFKHWFAFSCWTALPLLINAVVAAIFLLISDTTQLAPGVLQPLSLNELVFHRPLGSPGQAFLENVNLASILSWVLGIIGVQVWSKRSWLFSTIFVLLPSVAFYGIWAIFDFK
jgi:Yip1-like protein